MSNLYILLIVIGVLIIVAVLAYNWWQERKFNQQVDNGFSALQKDALLDDPEVDSNQVKSGFEDTIIDDFAIKHQKNVADPSVSEPHLTTRPTPQYQAQSVSNAVSQPEDAIANPMLPDDVSINEAFSELTNALKGTQTRKVEPTFNTANLASTTGNVNAPEKPVVRSDIKAIFDDAFGKTSKPLSANLDNTATEQKSRPTANIANEIEKPPLGLPAMLQAQMDLTAVLHLAKEIPASLLIKTVAGLFNDYDKPIFVHTIATRVNANPSWLLLSETPEKQLIAKIACSLQLADRAGAVSRNVLNRFQQAVETLGKGLNAHVEWQSSGDALTTATALDTFCIEVDKTIGFHLVHGESGAFTGTKLKGLAEAQGFKLAADGSFKFYNDAGKVAFIMFNRDNFPFSQDMLRNSVIKGITFQLDIPHVLHCAEAFNQMVEIARLMESSLHATLVDDNNRVLGDIQVEKIRQQLKVIHATMLVRGIIPGSDNAIRLFS